MHSHKFIEHTADIAAVVEGDSYEELIIAAAEALACSIAGSIEPAGNLTHNISLRAESPEELLVDYLNELNYLVEVRKQLYSVTERIAISEKDNIFELYAEVKLNEMDPEQNLENEIKAITYHQIKIEYKDSMYSTMIVFDI